MALDMGKDFGGQILKKVIYIKANIRMIKKVVLENILGKMELHILVHLRMILGNLFILFRHG
jgi:hypothetical protein